MGVKLATGSCHEQKSSNCPHQSKINNHWDLPVRACLAASACVRYLNDAGCALLLMWWEWARPLSSWPLTFWHNWPGSGPPPGMAGTARSRVMEVDYLHHAGNGLLWWGVVKCHDVPFGVDQAVLYYWHCLWWAFGGRLKFLGEWASLRNRMVPSFRPSFRSIECTLYPCSGCDWMKVVGYLLPHGLQGAPPLPISHLTYKSFRRTFTSAECEVHLLKGGCHEANRLLDLCNYYVMHMDPCEHNPSHYCILTR